MFDKMVHGWLESMILVLLFGGAALAKWVLSQPEWTLKPGGGIL